MKRKTPSERKNTIAGTFAFAVTLFSWWYYIKQFREPFAEFIPSYSQAGTIETLYLVAACCVVAYGVFETVLFLKTGNTIDEEEVVSEFLAKHDRTFSLRTQILIWIALLSVFILFLFYLLPIAMTI